MFWADKKYSIQNTGRYMETQNGGSVRHMEYMVGKAIAHSTQITSRCFTSQSTAGQVTAYN